MRELATVAVMGGLMTAGPLALRLSAGASAAVSIAACAAATAVACEGLSALTVAAGALGALAFHALAPHDVVVAGAALTACVFGPRSLRARTTRWSALHLAASLAGGAAAAWVAWRHGGASGAAVRVAAVGVAGLLASVSLLAPADDAIAYALARAQHDVTGAVAEHVTRALELRRRIEGSATVETLAEDTARRIEMAWRALVEIVAQRATLAGLGGSSVSVIERRIEQHVEALERIHASVDERFARAAGITDPRLAAVRLDSETIETEVRALTEVS
jgi:hypothetical protein